MAILSSRNVLSIAVLVTAMVIYWKRKERDYTFSPEIMHEISKQAIAEGREESLKFSSTNDNVGVDVDGDMMRLNLTIESVVRRLRQRYPGRVLPNAQWMFNNAGGAMGSMLVLHCSLSEYVIIFGTAVGTEGHTGRFLADDYFTMLYGEQWAFSTGSLQKEVYKPGDQHWLPRGTAKQYRMPDAAWALEYARGNILSMLPFGFADSFSSTLDFWTLGQTVFVSAYGVLRELFL